MYGNVVEKPKLYTEAKGFFNSGTIRPRCTISGMIEEANDVILWPILTKKKKITTVLF